MTSRNTGNHHPPGAGGTGGSAPPQHDEQSKFEALAQMSAAVSELSDTPDAWMAHLVQTAAELVGAERGTLFLVDSNTGELVSRVAQGAGVIRVPQGEGLVGDAVSRQACVRVDDAYADPRFARGIDEATGYETHTVLVVPLCTWRGATIGALELLNAHRGRFTEHDERVAEVIARQAASWIEANRLYHELLERSRQLEDARARAERRAQELDALHHVGEILAAAPHWPQGVERICALLRDALDAGCVSVSWRTRDGAEHTIASPPGRPCGRTDGGTVVRVELESGQAPAEEAFVEARWEAHSEHDVAAARRLLQLAGRAMAGALRAEATRHSQAEQARLAAVGEATAALVHDMRTPLAVVRAYMELMAEEVDAAERKRLADRIDGQLTAIVYMAREVLRFARGERGILPRKTRMDEFFRELRPVVDLEMQRHGIDVRWDIAYAGNARIDPVAIHRVVLNLARNAWQAMDGAGTFEVRCRAEEGDLVLEFADSGPGIAPEIAARVFERFVSSGKRGRTGLGLAIVRQVVEEHGGTVTFDSKPGRGTTFVLRLPLAGPPRGQRGDEASRGGSHAAH